MKAPLCETVYLVTANFTTVYFVMQDSRCTKARPKKRRPEQSFVQNYLFQFFFCLCLQDGFAFLFLLSIQVEIDNATDQCTDTETDCHIAGEVAD